MPAYLRCLHCRLAFRQRLGHHLAARCVIHHVRYAVGRQIEECVLEAFPWQTIVAAPQARKRTRCPRLAPTAADIRPLRAFPHQLTSHFPARPPHLIQVEGPHADVGVGNDVWVKRPVTKSSRHRQTTLDAPPQHTAARSAHACDLCWAHLREGAKCGSVEMGQDAAGKGRQRGGRGPSAAPRSRRARSANNTAQHSTNTDAKIKATHRQVSSQSCQGSAVNPKPALPVAGVCGPLTAGRACGRHLTLQHTPNSIWQYQATSNNT